MEIVIKLVRSDEYVLCVQALLGSCKLGELWNEGRAIFSFEMQNAVGSNSKTRYVHSTVANFENGPFDGLCRPSILVLILIPHFLCIVTILHNTGQVHANPPQLQ